MTANRLEAIERVGLFAGLSPTLQRRLASLAGLQHFGEGALLFKEGERAYYVYGIVSGTVALVSGAGAHESVIDFFGDGETLLVPPALLDLPYMVSARATSDGVAVLLPAEAFRELMAEEGALALACAQLLSRHWRVLLRQLKQVKIRDADARLAQYFLESAGRSSGSAVLPLPGLKRELATHLGIAPETLSRSLKRLRGLGVTAKGESINIESLKRLAEFVGTPSPAARAATPLHRSHKPQARRASPRAKESLT